MNNGLPENYAMPDAWLWISGTFFVLGTIAYLVIVVTIVLLVVQLKTLEGKVSALLERIDRIGQKLEQLSERVDRVAQKLEQLTENAQESTASIGTSVSTIAANLAMVSSSLALPVAKFAPLLGFATMAFRVYQGFRSNRERPPQRTLTIKSKKSPG